MPSRLKDTISPTEVFLIKKDVIPMDNGIQNENLSLKSEIISWIKVIAAAVVIALILDFFVIANAVVPTGSMENTVPTGSRIIGFRLYYLFNEPKRGDIVIFKFPDDESTDYLKRIIGMPGDTVEVIDGDVYINNSETPLKEDYLCEEPYGDFGPYEVPEGCYFMMGDNRNVSVDSRFWDNTFVEKKKLIAKAFIMYYPSIKWIGTNPVY